MTYYAGPNVEQFLTPPPYLVPILNEMNLKREKNDNLLLLLMTRIFEYILSNGQKIEMMMEQLNNLNLTLKNLEKRSITEDMVCNAIGCGVVDIISHVEGVQCGIDDKIDELLSINKKKKNAEISAKKVTLSTLSTLPTSPISPISPTSPTLTTLPTSPTTSVADIELLTGPTAASDATLTGSITGLKKAGLTKIAPISKLGKAVKQKNNKNNKHNKNNNKYKVKVKSKQDGRIRNRFKNGNKEKNNKNKIVREDIKEEPPDYGGMKEIFGRKVKYGKNYVIVDGRKYTPGDMEYITWSKRIRDDCIIGDKFESIMKSGGNFGAF